MQPRAGLLSLSILATASSGAPAAEKAQQPSLPAVTAHGTIDIERRYTTNALDRPEAWPDWLNALRGGVSITVPLEKAALRLNVLAEQTAHDVYAIEDDSSLRLSLGGEYPATDRLSVGAETSFTLQSEGDDVDVDGMVLGIRTRTLASAAAVRAGYRFSETLSLAGEISASLARPGPSLFEAALVEPRQLSARRDTLGAGLRLTRTDGTSTYAGAAGAELIRAGVEGELPYHYRAGRQFARAEASARWGGLALDAALGAERLALADAAFDAIRPSLTLVATYTFPGGQRLRGAAAAALDLTGGDDPLGSWLRSVEIEASAPAGERFTLSAGGSLSRRENFLLGYDEDGWSLWAGVTGRLADGLSMKAELGRSARRASVPDAPQIASLDASVSLSLALPVQDTSR